jgi:hypothetical protein
MVDEQFHPFDDVFKYRFQFGGEAVDYRRSRQRPRLVPPSD